MYNILRVALLIPTYLKFDRLHLFSHQRIIDCKLYWTSAVATTLIIFDLVMTSAVQQYKLVWLAFAPILLESLVIIKALKLIEAEIELLEFIKTQY